MTDGPTIFKRRQRAAWMAGNWDVDAYHESFEANFGPGLAAKAVLGDAWALVQRERRAVMAQFIAPIAAGGYRLRQDYLVTIGRKPT